LAGVVILTLLGRWYKRNGHAVRRPRVVHLAANLPARRQVIGGLLVLFCLMLSKWFYLASFTSYYVFYLMEKFPLSEGDAQIYLFIFLASVAVGTLIGGSVGDRIGRKKVIWGSILGALPFALILPYVGLGATVMLSIAIGLILSSAFSAIVVYAQELVPGRIGMISGLFFGLAFGLGGIGAAILGVMADHFGLGPVYQLCAWLPAIGFLAIFLPDIEHGPNA
jgi:FSR family fosmidomycin resistance protein-like MFS transporter